MYLGRTQFPPRKSLLRMPRPGTTSSQRRATGNGLENETAITKDVRILEQGAATMFTITEAKHSAPYGRIACK
jgi:hypothetical protein